MQDDKWEQLKEEIKRKFKLLEEKIEDLLVDTEDGLVKQGFMEILILEGPGGKLKLIRESRPVVLDKKFIYSHRAGQSARTEYKFSDSEYSHKLRAFRWDEKEDAWKEIDANALS